jgi:dolichol-phosphate mannosyltransferase
MNKNSLGIIVPVYNEEPVIEILLEALTYFIQEPALKKYDIEKVHCIFIDDGSSDSTSEILKKHIDSGFPGILYRLTRNFGHQAAITAGLNLCNDDIVVIMDADMQDPPEIIPQMLEKWSEGWSVVYAKRKKRKENIIKRFCYASFYRILRFLSDVQVPLDSGDFCLMDKCVVQAMKKLPENLRFHRILRAWVGFKQTGIEYDRPARKAGETKYSFSRLYKLATDGIASASILPLKLTQFISFSFLLASVSIIIFLLYSYIFGSFKTLSPAILGLYGLICLSVGIQSFCFYILGAYVGRSYLEIKGRPPYLLLETISATEESFIVK